MNVGQILALLQGIGMNVATMATQQALVPIIVVMIATNPGITDDQIIANEDGTLKHWLRGRIAFFVDIVWGGMEPTVDEQIKQAIVTARAQIAANASAPVANTNPTPAG